MSNVIIFLERMGRDAQLRHVVQSDVQLALTRAQIDPQLHAAIIDRDQERLEALLGGNTVSCVMFYDDNDESESETCLEQYA